ncbi:2-amino-4-hydroxy-6-hydroxymethyldihydropteridine diphosphokinase [Oerskovia sp. NPDC060287]|uniref:2-amino-4-hydroxy-6- hydroxymethyldihydropteridine diphosphokinase n=1 Tax=Oerskovia sp. NPDC060287 TaxID=3347095 RepID=UPI00365793C0
MSTAFQGAVHGTDGRPLDQIRLTGLSATGHHGVFEHERIDGQLFRADVVLHLDTRRAASGDDLEDTVSYAVVAEDVVEVLAGSPADLIETVAERVAAVALRHPTIEAVDVAIHKPQAPITVPFDDVEVVIRRDRVKVPVVAVESARVVPLPVGSITPAVLGNVSVGEPGPAAGASVEAPAVMPPSIPPAAPVAAPDRSTDQGFLAVPEDLGAPAAESVTSSVSDAEFVEALDSFYSAPEDALSAPAPAPFVEEVVVEPAAVQEVSAPEAAPAVPDDVAPVSLEAPALPEAVAPEPAPDFAPVVVEDVSPAPAPAVVDGPVAVDEVVAPEAQSAEPPVVHGAAAYEPVPAESVVPVVPVAAAEPVADEELDTPAEHPAAAPVPAALVEPSAPAASVEPAVASIPSEPTAPEAPAASDQPVEQAQPAPIESLAPVAPVDPVPVPEQPVEIVHVAHTEPPVIGELAETAETVPALEAAQLAAEAPVAAEPTPEPVLPPVAAPEPTVQPAPEPEPVPVTDRLDEAPAGFVPVVLALGANLGDAQQTLRDAVTDLDRISGLEITEVSPLARTAAVGGPDQPDYLNAILLARTTLSPRALLRACQGVENAHGRVRAERNGPRTLDVDLIVYGTVAEITEDLELPHPRAHERAFVLEPWAQVAPEAFLPGLGGGPVATLAATAPDRGGIRWLALDWLTDAEPEPAPAATPAAVPVDEPAAAPAQATPDQLAPAEPAVSEPAVPERPDEPEAPQAALEQPAFAPAPAPAPAPVVQERPAAPAEPAPFVPAFHPVHPQDGQEPPHPQVPPLWSDVSAQGAADHLGATPPTGSSDDEAPALPSWSALTAPAQQAAPGPQLPPQTAIAPEPVDRPAQAPEPAAPAFRPVHESPASAFQPVHPAQPVPPAQPVKQEPITGVPMSFPADLRGPSS